MATSLRWRMHSARTKIYTATAWYGTKMARAAIGLTSLAGHKTLLAAHVLGVTALEVV